MQNLISKADKLALGISVALLAFLLTMTIVELVKWSQDYSLGFQTFLNIQPRNAITYQKLNK